MTTSAACVALLLDEELELLRREAVVALRPARRRVAARRRTRTRRSCPSRDRARRRTCPSTTPCSMRRMSSTACVTRRSSVFAMPACASAPASVCLPSVPRTISIRGIVLERGDAPDRNELGAGVDRRGGTAPCDGETAANAVWTVRRAARTGAPRWSAARDGRRSGRRRRPASLRAAHDQRRARGARARRGSPARSRDPIAPRLGPGFAADRYSRIPVSADCSSSAATVLTEARRARSVDSPSPSAPIASGSRLSSVTRRTA